MKRLAAAQFGAASISLCSEGEALSLFGVVRFDQLYSYLSHYCVCLFQCPNLRRGLLVPTVGSNQTEKGKLLLRLG